MGIQPRDSGKLEALDSVRGLAALIVVCAHQIDGFFPELHGEQEAFSPWLRFWNDGRFAVDVFFLLSGFVLAVSYVRTGNMESLRSAAVRRYWRLFVPVAALIFLSYLLLAGGLYANADAAAAAGQSEKSWLNHWFRFEPSMFEAVTESFWGVFFSFSYERTYNTVLWTMGFELIGSFFVFAFLALFGKMKNRYVFYGVVGYALYHYQCVWLMEFLAGTALCDAYYSARLHRYAEKPIVVFSSIFTVATGLTLGGLSADWFAVRPDLPSPSTAVAKYFMPVGAFLVLIGVLGSAPLQRWLTIRPLMILGAISFPLYLVHLPVQCSLGCHLYLVCVNSWGLSLQTAGILASAATVAVSLPLAWVGSKTIEPFSIWVGRKVYALVFDSTHSATDPSKKSLLGDLLIAQSAPIVR